MKPRLSLAATVVLPSFSPTSNPSVNGLVAGLLGPDHLEQRHHLGRIEEVEPDHPLGTIGRIGLRGDGERGGVGREVGVVLDDLVELAPHLELAVEVLGDRLDHEVAVGEVRVFERRA